MKNWLTKFRLSNALDKNSPAPVPGSLRRKIGANPELRDFARRAAEVDLRLRRPPSVPSADATLHPAIMRAVRATAAETAQPQLPLRIGLATAFGALAVAALLLALHFRTEVPLRASSKSQRELAVTLVKNIGEMSRTMPDQIAVVAPLSNELASVDHDLRDTTRFILASLP